MGFGRSFLICLFWGGGLWKGWWEGRAGGGGGVRGLGVGRLAWILAYPDGKVGCKVNSVPSGQFDLIFQRDKLC